MSTYEILARMGSEATEAEAARMAEIIGDRDINSISDAEWFRMVYAACVLPEEESRCGAALTVSMERIGRDRYSVELRRKDGTIAAIL